MRGTGRSPLQQLVQLYRLADAEEDAVPEAQQVGLRVGQHAVHALVPDGQHEREVRAVGDEAADAPLEADVLLVDVDAALGEDVHPVAAREPLETELDGGLVHAGAAHHRHALAQREEPRVQRAREADVVRRERPAHSRAAHQRHVVQYACAHTDTPPSLYTHMSRASHVRDSSPRPSTLGHDYHTQ